ncbi:hypothetical protein [Flavivirga sp. 57AJ16]|uniref:hypothetical protein n=1 Tax=Flavivirga sp. 57AJ16 TaxID=3025307 RepID=UPI00236589D0|nr:hypothetical protein [Flavivirga sp. 57AJ16]
MEKQNPFKNIGQPPHDVPEDIRNNIMKSITTAKHLMKIKLLFKQNHKAAMSSLFKRKINKPPSN